LRLGQGKQIKFLLLGGIVNVETQLFKIGRNHVVTTRLVGFIAKCLNFNFI